MKFKKKDILLIETICLITQIYALFDFSFKNSNRYSYHSFMNEVKYEIKSRGLKYSWCIFRPVFSNYQDTNIAPQCFFIFLVFLIQFINFIFLIIGFYINYKKIHNTLINIVTPICFFIINLFTAILELYFVTFYEEGKLNLTENELNEFGEFKKTIVENLNSVTRRIFYLRIYAFYLVFCSIIHIIITFILKNIVEIESSNEIISKKKSKDKYECLLDEEINEENNNMENKNEKFIKFDDETDKLITMKLVSFIMKKLS